MIDVAFQVLGALVVLYVLAWIVIAVVAFVGATAALLLGTAWEPRRVGEAPTWPLGVVAVLAAIVAVHKLLTWLS